MMMHMEDAFAFLEASVLGVLCWVWLGGCEAAKHQAGRNNGILCCEILYTLFGIELHSNTHSISPVAFCLIMMMMIARKYHSRSIPNPSQSSATHPCSAELPCTTTTPPSPLHLHLQPFQHPLSPPPTHPITTHTHPSTRSSSLATFLRKPQLGLGLDPF